MEIVSLRSTNFIGLTSNYVYDKALNFEENVIYTENDVNFPKSTALINANDVSTNNYSHLFLTYKNPLTSSVYIRDLKRLEDEGFATYLAINAINGINGNSTFLVVEEPPQGISTANIKMSGTSDLIDNRYLFEIEFIDDTLCYIKHENNLNERYMTIDYLGNITFTKKINYDHLYDLSPQLFHYLYDRDQDFIVFYKNISDIAKYVTYSIFDETLVLTEPLTGVLTPYTTQSIFKCISRNESPNNTKLFDSWVSYTKDLHTNSQEIRSDKSINHINSNLLLNAEYNTLTGTSLDLNVLSLKNTNTPENFQSRNNPFSNNKTPLFTETDAELRDYKRIFSGSNQVLGNDNITLGYDTYTTDIVLKSDAITYFHIPQNTYPFIKLNISESGLTEAGAIAGDHPLKSDKIFKRLGNNKYTSHFGESIEESTGSFLCSWLSGNHNPDAKPIWVDRYYNPSKVSFFGALSTNELQAVKYKTLLECLAGTVADILKDVTVFDKPSDMLLEPGTYFAYHHYGRSDVDNYIQSLEDTLVQEDITTIRDTKTMSDVFYENTEYIFDGSIYGATKSLSAIQDSGQFTLSFFAHSNDWNKPFAGQLIGNYATDGFGIFNQNTLTPTLYVPTLCGCLIYNTDIQRIKQLNYKSSAAALLRSSGITSYYVVHRNGELNRYSASDTLLQSIKLDDFSSFISYDSTDTESYLLYGGVVSSDRHITRVNISQGIVTDITNDVLSDLTVRFAHDTFKGWLPTSSPSTLLKQASSIDFYNGYLYFTPGKTATRVDDTIYYLRDNNTIMKWESIENSTPLPAVTAFRAKTVINDFEIDYQNNMWILADNNKYYKYNLEREFVLSGSFVKDQYTNYNIGFIADFNDGNYYQQAVVTRLGREQLPPPPANPSNTTLSAQNYNFHVLDLQGNQLSSFKYEALTGSSIFDPTNSDYLRKFVSNRYPDSNLNVKATLSNAFNVTDTVTLDLPFSLSAVDPGYHHFAVRFDTYNGYMFLFVDGQQVDRLQFEPRKYKFNGFINRPFLIGTSCFTNSVPLFNYTQKQTSITKGITIKDFRLYNEPMNYFDISFLAKRGMEIQDIHFNVPCGRRAYLEEIERYFKASVPGTKSGLYNVLIKNSGIIDESVKGILEQRVIQTLQNSAPVYSKLNKIIWETPGDAPTDIVVSPLANNDIINIEEEVL